MSRSEIMDQLWRAPRCWVTGRRAGRLAVAPLEPFQASRLSLDGNRKHRGGSSETRRVCFMSEDLAKQLASYKAQLQQVEAALSGNGENEDLLKLKKDLQEVIELTKDLLSTQPSETLASSDSFASTQPTHSWKVGDKCMAIWSEDGQCYEAEIEEIDEENGTAAITFAGYGNAEVTPLLNLKPVEEGRKAKEDSGNKPMSK
ncbi:survival of motor neuron-related-splicing factor 30 isoform X2 [Panthera tigris]|uniref:survival of motor neuron-related-splicing factor 30 isoform X2 n=1 Tax=Panthera leo TaxID=9689 RepID=UPI001C697D47|nr:survival of motor neuron-related-splicing factor 30 isoform X2 [Panthera leo]XP_042816101.1 survival of motor neuron-related-splicing factor 30 isoform X2 [Panthera tigris]